MATRVSEQRPAPPPRRNQRQGVWSALFSATIGNAFSLLQWSLLSILVSIIIEWVGMVFWWELTHSAAVLEREMGYLGSTQRNLLLNVYPAEVGLTFIGYAQRLVHWALLPEIGRALADTFGAGIGMGVQAVINIIFLFAVRLAICVSALTGFLVVGLVALIDGLVQRDIRRDCGGIESSTLFHWASRWIKPVLFVAFGGYLTWPTSVHPTLVFLPVIGVFGLMVFTAAKSYKKFL